MSWYTECMSDLVEQLLVQVGEIGVTQKWVHTPVGACPLKGAMFSLMDMHQERSKRPTWTIVVAILLFPLGLFALLAKDTECFGFVNVTVQNVGFTYTTQVRVGSQSQVWDTQNQVTYLRELAQWAMGEP